MNYEVTLFGRINWTTYGLRTITVQDAVCIIRNGSYLIDDSKRSRFVTSLRVITELIQRQPLDTDLQPIKEQYLPAVSFNGVYNNGIMKYSNVTAMDFDHIPSQEEFTGLYLRLVATPCVGWIYRTPSGRGLKALVLHDNTNPGMHTNMYNQLLEKFQTPYIKTDLKCKDLSRRNYLCYDPDIWSNPSPVPYHFVFDPAFDTSTPGHVNSMKVKQTCVQDTRPLIVAGTLSDASIMYMLKSRCKRFHPEYFIEGARRDGVYWFGTQASKAGVEYQYGLEYVSNLYQSNEIKLTRGGAFTYEEVVENYTNGYNVETYDEEYRKGFNTRKTV